MNPESALLYHFGDFTLHLAARRLTRGDHAVVLTPKGFDVLLCLVRQPGQLVTRETLLTTVWPGTVVEEANLSQQIFAVRKALGDCAAYVMTVPGRGYQFTQAVSIEDLTPPAPEPLTSSSAANQPPAPHRWLLPALLASVATLALIGWLGWRYLHASQPAQPYNAILADFHNATNEPDLDTTLREALEISLTQSSSLKVLSRGEVVSVLKRMEQPPQTRLEPALAREVCERSNQDVLITGAITRVGSKYVLTSQVTSCAGGSILAGSHVAASSADGLLAAVDQAARDLRKALGESAATIRRSDVPLERATTPSLDALKAYSLGDVIESRGADNPAAIRLYQHAVELDPRFALAWQALSNLYYAANEPAQASSAALKAFQLSDRVTDRERFAIRMNYHANTEEDLPAAINVGREWAAAYPTDWRPLALMTGQYNDLNRFEDAVRVGRQALALSDHQALIYSDLARAERRLGHWDAVRLLGDQAIQHGVDSTGLHGTLLQNAFATGDQPALDREYAWIDAHPSWYGWSLRANIAAFHGHMREASRLFAQARLKAIENNQQQTSDEILLNEAELLFAFGKQTAARELAINIRTLTSSDQAQLAVLRLRLGDRSTALAFLQDANTLPHSSLTQYGSLPRVNAALAMQAGKPADAAKILEPVVNFLEADYLHPRQHAAAIEAVAGCEAALPDWNIILTHPGVDPVSLALPIARLERARCYARMNHIVESRAAYAQLLDIWKSADPDLPLVASAREESARLAASER